MLNNILPFCKPFDIIVFHEKDLISFKKNIISGDRVIYKEIEFKLPDYPEEILVQIPKFYPHPAHGHEGFTMGYRHMCRFFFSEIFPLLNGYQTYMRLDTDSYILDPINYDIFDWFNSHELIYSFIAAAVQIDNQTVCRGLNDEVFKWLDDNSLDTEINILEIPNGKLFYTNFEMCNICWFSNSSKSKNFYKFINETGKIFSERWGDHILRYLQVSLFCNPAKVQPVVGIHYEHGVIYKT